MLFDKRPDFHGVFMVAVKGTVDKFHLCNLFFKEISKLFFYQRKAAKPQLFFHGRETIAATKRTAAARLVIDNLVFEILNVPIAKRYLVHIHHSACLCNCNFRSSVICDSVNFRKRFPVSLVIAVHLAKCLFSLSHHDTGHFRMFFQKSLYLVRHFRTSHPDWNIRAELMIFCD